jgi:hypothetical protein
MGAHQGYLYDGHDYSDPMMKTPPSIGGGNSKW